MSGGGARNWLRWGEVVRPKFGLGGEESPCDFTRAGRCRDGGEEE